MISLSLDSSLGPAGSKGASPPPFFGINIDIYLLVQSILLINVFEVKCDEELTDRTHTRIVSFIVLDGL